MNDLKPCPFCGEAPSVRQWKTQGYIEIECVNMECAFCPRLLRRVEDEEAAIEAWNRRATVDQGMGKEAS